MKAKRKLAAKILKISPKKVSFAVEALDEIKKAITRSDIRGLIAVKKIVRKKTNSQSKVRARKIAKQKSKGRQKGAGSKKGRKFASVTRKERWMTKIRVQRAFLEELRGKWLLSPKDYRKLYAKSGGGYFRNKRHIKLYMADQKLIEGKKVKEGLAN